MDYVKWFLIRRYSYLMTKVRSLPLLQYRPTRKTSQKWSLLPRALGDQLLYFWVLKILQFGQGRSSALFFFSIDLPC